jgi:hypothetical protein
MQELENTALWNELGYTPTAQGSQYLTFNYQGTLYSKHQLEISSDLNTIKVNTDHLDEELEIFSDVYDFTQDLINCQIIKVEKMKAKKQYNEIDFSNAVEVGSNNVMIRDGARSVGVIYQKGMFSVYVQNGDDMFVEHKISFRLY